MNENDFKLTEHFTLFEMTDSKEHPDLVQKNREYFNHEPYLSRLQFLCHYGLEAIREIVGKPIMILSGGRCPELNKAVGGVKDSQHQARRLNDGAADFHVPGMTIEDVANLILKHKEVFFRQLIIYRKKGFIHYGLPLGDAKDGQVIWKPTNPNIPDRTPRTNLLNDVNDICSCQNPDPIKDDYKNYLQIKYSCRKMTELEKLALISKVKTIPIKSVKSTESKSPDEIKNERKEYQEKNKEKIAKYMKEYKTKSKKQLCLT
jgi:zinc D-Ala-D-Ala carboxypeptidase